MTRNDLQFNATCVLSENRLPRNYPRVNHVFFEICHQLWEKHWRFRTTLPTCIQKVETCWNQQSLRQVASYTEDYQLQWGALVSRWQSCSQEQPMAIKPGKCPMSIHVQSSYWTCYFQLALSGWIMAGIWDDPTSHVNGLFRGMRIVNWGTVFGCVCWASSTGSQTCIIGIYWEIWCKNSYPHQNPLLSRISMDPEFRNETVPYANRILVLLLMFWKPCWNSSRCGLVPQLWPGSLVLP